MNEFITFVKKTKWQIITGLFIGVFAIFLVSDVFGTEKTNPANMGICSACFIRDTAGAVGFHSVDKLSYVRPEVVGITLGAFALALASKKFKVTGGDSPVSRMALGSIMMIGALVFLGCPLRMILRLSAGDLNALVGLGGLIAGISVGVFFKNKGTTLELDQEIKQTKAEGFFFPVLMFSLIFVAIFVASTATAAPIYLSLPVGLGVGALAYKSNFCTISAFKNPIFYRSFSLLIAVGVLFVSALIGNLITGNFNFGFENQPVAHNDHIYNFIGLFIVGWAGVLAAGCPLRQLVKAGSGNLSAVITIVGLFIGAGIAHNFKIAASGAGASENTLIAVIVCIALLGGISVLKLKRN